MDGAAALVVFVLAHDASQPATQAFAEAAHDVLGAEASIAIRVVAQDLSDGEAVRSAGDADGIVELSWNDDHTRARLHCYVRREQRWIDRSILFDRGDLERERGRMLGFAVASMFAEPPDTKAPVPPSKTATALADNTAEADHRLGGDPRQEPPGAGINPEGRHSLDFSAVVTTGVGGEADALGAAAALCLPISGAAGVRISLGGRAGEIPRAQANTRTALLGSGISWSLLDSTSRYELSVRSDLLATWMQVGHLSADDPDVDRQSRWLFGADALLTGGIALSPGALLLAAGGVEGMFGKTEIYTHGQRVATVPPVRVVVELGVRSRF